MKYLRLLPFFILLTSCSDSIVSNDNMITYFNDTRTKLCFSVINLHTRDGRYILKGDTQRNVGFLSVECTKEVLNIAKTIK
jgi:hypothetical protein